MSSSFRPSWKLLSSLLMLSFVPVVAGVVRLSSLSGSSGVTPENARFMAMPAPVVLHIVCASLFCVLGALQFDSALRQRFPRLHRIAGRVAAPCGIVAALTGLWMTVAYAIPAELQGPLLYGVRMVVGLAMTLAVVVSVRAVLQRRITQHKAWMVRAYALGQGAGTQVLILLPVTLMAGAPTFIFRDVLMASAWGLNVAFAEWVIRRRLPSI
ncbi:MAG: DUF2306 domain-containing protein [Ramlibacter sp.]|nr:DUF2306 domain-containing protein [Ramlibacter sp.]